MGALTLVSFALMVLGASVRAHGAGLACPDWPLCFGQVVPEFDLRVGFEWGHRVLASVVSLGLAAMSFWIYRTPALWKPFRRKLAGAWVLLGVQVVLGGLTVLLRLAPWTVVAHLVTGASFGLVLLWISRDLLELERPVARAELPASATWLGLATVVCLGLQMLLGGLVSSHGAGLACADFPTCDGQSFVPTLYGLVGVHVLHRLNGLLLLGCFTALAWSVRADRRAARLAWLALRLVVLQIVLGAINVLFRLPVEVTALHSAIALAIVALTALLVRERVRVGSPAPRPAAADRVLHGARVA